MVQAEFKLQHLLELSSHCYRELQRPLVGIVVSGY